MTDMNRVVIPWSECNEEIHLNPSSCAITHFIIRNPPELEGRQLQQYLSPEQVSIRFILTSRFTKKKSLLNSSDELQHYYNFSLLGFI